MEYMFLVRDGIDLEKIATSGQCFRMQQLPDNRFRVITDDCCAILNQRRCNSGNLLYVYDSSMYDLYDFWRRYFDIDTNYRSICNRVSAADDIILQDACKAGFGLRILKQDLWETLITFIISQNRNIAAIRNSIELLCEICGEVRHDCNGDVYHAFPSPYDIRRCRDEVRDRCKLGYRYEYVMSATEQVAVGKLRLDLLQSLPDDALLKRLQELSGVGPKVAACVALFGYHRLNVVPVDVWVKRIFDTYYPDGFPYDTYSPYCGVYQQYLFEHLRGRDELLR